MGGKGKGKGGASAGRSKAVEVGGSSLKVMAAAGATGSLKLKDGAALKEVLASSAAGPGDLKLKAKAAAAVDEVNYKQTALKIKAKAAAPGSLKTKAKEAAAAGTIKKSGVPKATLKSSLSVDAVADKSEGEEEHDPDEEVEDDSEEDPDYDPEDDSEEDPDYDPNEESEEESDGEDPEDDPEPDDEPIEEGDDYDVINTVDQLQALVAQGPIVRNIRVERVPSTHHAAVLYDALLEVQMPPGMSIINLEPLRHLKLGCERVDTRILSGSILRLRNRPQSQTTKARLRKQARSLKATARAVKGDFRARGEDVAEQLIAFSNRVNEPKNSPDLDELRLVVQGLLNDPVSFQEGLPAQAQAQAAE